MIFQMAEVAVPQAVRQIDAIFAIEREINGLSAESRLAVRTTRIAPLVSELENWMRGERARLSRHADVAKAMACSSAGSPSPASSATAASA